jgi:hypothetical protein
MYHFLSTFKECITALHTMHMYCSNLNHLLVWMPSNTHPRVHWKTWVPSQIKFSQQCMFSYSATSVVSEITSEYCRWWHYTNQSSIKRIHRRNSSLLFSTAVLVAVNEFEATSGYALWENGSSLLQNTKDSRISGWTQAPWLLSNLFGCHHLRTLLTIVCYRSDHKRPTQFWRKKKDKLLW